LERLPSPPFSMDTQTETGAKKWYVIHTYAGYENRVETNLARRVESMNMKDRIFRILVPTEKEITSKGGQKKTVEKKVFPGYVMVEMILDDDSWSVVRNTPGVTGFVGPGSKPVSLSEKEINRIMRQMGMAAEGKPRIDFEVGQVVRVISGPFKNFEGTVEEINQEKGTVKVLVSMFGRETPVELGFHQVEKY
jgi:transcriptional antiterminator NusG